MKWMRYDKKKGEISFKLEEHEIDDDMLHHIYFDGPKNNVKDAERVNQSVGPSKINSEWLLKFKLPENMALHMGQWNFVVTGFNKLNNGDRTIASGFSYGTRWVCHQAITISMS
jgi:hypothetical protein